MTEKVQELINEAIAYMGAKNFKEAEDVLKKALEEDNQSFDIYIHLGNALVSQKKIDEGIQSFKTALMLKPDDGMILYSIGCAYFLKNDYVEAVKYLNQAEEKKLDYVDLYTIKAVVYANSGNFVQAIREVSKAIEMKPFGADLYQRKIVLQIEAGYLDDAIATLQEFREIMPDSLEGYELGVELYCKQEDYAEAEKLLLSGKERFPDDLSFDYLFLKFYVLMERYEEAKRIGAFILSSDIEGSMRKETVIYMSQICNRLKQPDEARKILQDYARLGADGEILYLLMTLQYGEKEYEDVIQLADQLQTMDTEPLYIATAKLYRVLSIKWLKGKAEAKPLFQSLAKELRRYTVRHPDLYELYIYRILSHTEAEEYDKALDLTDFLDKAYPELVDGQLFKYHIYQTMGKQELADEAKKRVLEKEPDIDIQWNLQEV